MDRPGSLSTVAQVDPVREQMMQELADWHEQWARKWGVDDHFYEGESVDDWQSRIPPEAEAELRRRSAEIMAAHRSSPDPRPAATAEAGSLPPIGAAQSEVLPAARSPEEAIFYIDEQRCPGCGQHRTEWSASLLEIAGTLVRRYAGTCAACGRAREYLFQLPEHVTERPAAASVWFGGAEPSRIIDAGQWLGMSEQAAGSARAARARGDARSVARYAELASVFVGEARKFVPPGGEAVPETAVWSAAGRRLYAGEPGRFTLRRLNLLVQMLREEFPGVGDPS